MSSLPPDATPAQRLQMQQAYDKMAQEQAAKMRELVPKGAAPNSPRPQPLPPRPMPVPPRPPVQNVSPGRPVLPPRPSTQPRPPVQNVSPQRPVLPPRPSTQPVRPSVSPPQQPNVMGFPDRPLAPGATPRPQMGQMTPQQASAYAGRPSSQAAYNQYMQQATGGGRPANPFTVDRSLPAQPRPSTPFKGAGTEIGTTPMPAGGYTPSSPMNTNPIPQGAVPGLPPKATNAFKKGGKVAAKAPAKKVAAKAPVKKAMGGPIKAKPAAKPAAKMAKPMPAMKRGGKVMAKGRKK